MSLTSFARMVPSKVDRMKIRDNQDTADRIAGLTPVFMDVSKILVDNGITQEDMFYFGFDEIITKLKTATSIKRREDVEKAKKEEELKAKTKAERKKRETTEQIALTLQALSDAGSIRYSQAGSRASVLSRAQENDDDDDDEPLIDDVAVGGLDYDLLSLEELQGIATSRGMSFHRNSKKKNMMMLLQAYDVAKKSTTTTAQ